MGIQIVYFVGKNHKIQTTYPSLQTGRIITRALVLGSVTKDISKQQMVTALMDGSTSTKITTEKIS